MAESTVTQTGVAEMRAVAASLPALVLAASRKVAEATANRVLMSARQHLQSQLKTDATALVAAIAVEADDVNRQFRVTSFPPLGQGTNLPIWVEHGTIKMAPRPYMLPATKENERPYQVAMAEVIEATVRGALT